MSQIALLSVQTPEVQALAQKIASILQSAKKFSDIPQVAEISQSSCNLKGLRVDLFLNIYVDNSLVSVTVKSSKYLSNGTKISIIGQQPLIRKIVKNMRLGILQDVQNLKGAPEIYMDLQIDASLSEQIEYEPGRITLTGDIFCINPSEEFVGKLLTSRNIIIALPGL